MADIGVINIWDYEQDKYVPIPIVLASGDVDAYTRKETDAFLAEKQDKLTEGKGIDLIVTKDTDGDDPEKVIRTTIQVRTGDTLTFTEEGDPEKDRRIEVNYGTGFEINEETKKLDTKVVELLTALPVEGNASHIYVVKSRKVTYEQAEGTYVAGTTYYTDNTGTTEVDTTSFVEGVTDVSMYFVKVETDVYTSYEYVDEKWVKVGGSESGAVYTAGHGIDLTGDIISVVAEDKSIAVGENGVKVNKGDTLTLSDANKLEVNYADGLAEDATLKKLVVKAEDKTLVVGADGVKVNKGNGLTLDATSEKLEVKAADGSLNVAEAGVKVVKGNGIDKATEAVTVKAKDTSLVVDESGVKANIGKGLELDTTVNVKPSDTSIVSEEAGVKANIGNGLVLGTDSKKIEVKPEDTSLVVGESGVKVNVGNGLDLDATSKKIEVKEADDSIVVSADGVKVVVDDAISATSVHPVQNKIVKEELDKKQDIIKTGDHIEIAEDKVTVKVLVDDELSGISTHPVENKLVKKELDKAWDGYDYTDDTDPDDPKTVHRYGIDEKADAYDTYTKGEVNDLLDDKQDKLTIGDGLGLDIVTDDTDPDNPVTTRTLSTDIIRWVTEMPAEPDTHYVYALKSSVTDPETQVTTYIYSAYIYVTDQEDGDLSGWKNIGSTESAFDANSYFTKTQVNTLLKDYLTLVKAADTYETQKDHETDRKALVAAIAEKQDIFEAGTGLEWGESTIKVWRTATSSHVVDLADIIGGTASVLGYTIDQTTYALTDDITGATYEPSAVGDDTVTYTKIPLYTDYSGDGSDLSYDNNGLSDEEIANAVTYGRYLVKTATAVKKPALNFTLDTNPYAIVDAKEDGTPDVSNPIESKIYMCYVAATDDEDAYFTQFRWKDNDWVFVGNSTANVDMSNYVTKEQRAADLAQIKIITEAILGA